MSTEQSFDPQLIEQTKQQIRTLVGEIARLAKSDLAPAEFYGEFLTRVVSALAAIGGAVWTTEDEGRLTLQYQVNLQHANLHDSEEKQIQHSRLLYKVLSGGEPLLMPPHSGAGDDSEAANPTDCLLVLSPLKTDLEAVGVVEILQRPEAGISTQKGYVRFLQQMCDLAADFVKSRQLRHFSDRQVLWSRLEEFTRVVHASLEPRQTAYTIANEGRRLIECDRLSVAIRKGKHCTIEAVSGQDLFDKRSNTVRLLGRLAGAVVATGEPVWYTGDTTNMAPQVEDAVQEYVDEAHSKTVAVLPLQRRSAADEEEGPEDREEVEPPIGALIVEQIEDSRVPDMMRHRVDVVCDHSSAALANAMEHDSLFLMPLWRTLGKARWVLRARTLPKTIAVLVAILAVLAVLTFWPAAFELQAKGTLEPVLRSDVFAGIDGVVDDVLVNHGDQVKKDQLLVKLRNTDLEVAIADIVGQRTTTQQQILSAGYSLLSERKSAQGDQNRLSGELGGMKQKLESLNAQYSLYLQKQEDLKVTSPRSGQIVSWNVYDTLIHRPVQRGQVLMRVADRSGPWELELHMGDDRMGFIADAQKKLGKDLTVTFILATDPGIELEGKIKEVHYSAEVRGEEGNTVLIKVDIDKEKLPHLRPGATVTGKVYCGRRSLGFVWFHDLLAFIRSRILFRL